MDIAKLLADEFSIQPVNMQKTVLLLQEGNSVPFIARYFRETTRYMNIDTLRLVEKRMHALEEIKKYQDFVCQAIEQQGNLTPQLRKSILCANNKNRIDDLFYPFLQQNNDIDGELMEFAKSLYNDPEQDCNKLAVKFIDFEKQITSTEDVLIAARNLLVQYFAGRSDIVGVLREQFWTTAILNSQVVYGKDNTDISLKKYFDYRERLQYIPACRALSLIRGHKAGVLSLKLYVDIDFIALTAKHLGVINKGRPTDLWLLEAVKWAWEGSLKPRLEIDLLERLKSKAEHRVIVRLEKKLAHILTSVPAKKAVTIGFDNSWKERIQMVVVDTNGHLLTQDTLNSIESQQDYLQAKNVVLNVIRDYQVQQISIANGPACHFLRDFIVSLLNDEGIELSCHIVTREGIVNYAVSDFAQEELAELPVSVRSAISIARRLQDPLAELVKVPPEILCASQYCNDVCHDKLRQGLNAVIENCVCQISVDVNKASWVLLSKVSGIDEDIAKAIVARRITKGPFVNLQQIATEIPIGEHNFKQAAGFLRIYHGDNPLDATSIHPLHYDLVRAMANSVQLPVKKLIMNKDALSSLSIVQFIQPEVSLSLLCDIVAVLKNPWIESHLQLNANYTFIAEKITDLKVGMRIEGVVTNITNFGAFVDIGLEEQVGLVHISELSSRFIVNPQDIVKTGDVVMVKVKSIDLLNSRISLSMKINAEDKRCKHKEKNKE